MTSELVNVFPPPRETPLRAKWVDILIILPHCPHYPSQHPNHRDRVYGITKTYTDPRLDGWFFSDFFAFNYLLKGLGSSQTWLATYSTTASELVETYVEFLHGNPCRDRKVVLSQDLLDRGEITDVTVVPEDGFLHAAMEALQIEFRLSRETGSPVLLLLFCHGDEETHGVFLGDETSCRSKMFAV